MAFTLVLWRLVGVFAGSVGAEKEFQGELIEWLAWTFISQ